MSELKTYDDLTFNGWEWLLNCSDGAASTILTDMMFHDARTFCKGQPKSTGNYSSETLRNLGMVGVYTQGGGGRPVGTPVEPPPQPLFVDPPKTGLWKDKFKQPGQPTDSPPVEVLCS